MPHDPTIPERWHAPLAAFIAREGHARVPKLHTGDGIKLGNWVHKQRQKHHSGKMEPTQINALEALPGWAWTGDPRNQATRQSQTARRKQKVLERLSRYADAHGTTALPHRYRDPDGYTLGKTITNLRTEYAANNLDPAFAAKLAALPGWSWNGHAQRWTHRPGERAIEKLEALHVAGKQHGPAYSKRADQLRVRYRNGTLSDDERARAERLPDWSWGEATWNERPQPPRSGIQSDRTMLALLDAFIEREGHAQVPRRHTENDIRLGAWIATRRRWHRRGQLAETLRTALQARPDWTWEAIPAAKPSTPENALAALEAWTSTDPGRLATLEPDTHKHERRAIRTLTRLDRNEHLNDEQRTRLYQIPGWNLALYPYVDAERITEAREWLAGTRKANETPGLKSWIKRQRHRHRNGTLHPLVRAELEAIRGWRWEPRIQPEQPSTP